jgi:hypothetical protein
MIIAESVEFVESCQKRGKQGKADNSWKERILFIPGKTRKTKKRSKKWKRSGHNVGLDYAYSKGVPLVWHGCCL